METIYRLILEHKLHQQGYPRNDNFITLANEKVLRSFISMDSLSESYENN